MKPTKLTAAELRIMDSLWDNGPASIRELLEAYSDSKTPGYTTVQTLVYRLEKKGAIRRIRKIGGAHIFEAVISRNAIQRKMFDEFLTLFGGRTQPFISHLIETGQMTREDIDAAKRQLENKRGAKRGKSEMK